MYRVVPAAGYLRGFASDRHHMFQEGHWLASPPPYPCIKNEKNENHTLDKYYAMANKTLEECYGEVLDEYSFLLQMQYLQKDS